VLAGSNRQTDLAAWLEPPPRRSVLKAPRVRVIEAFLPPAACDRLIEAAGPHMAPLSPCSTSRPAATSRIRAQGLGHVMFVDLAQVHVITALAARLDFRCREDPVVSPDVVEIE
jgi:hypothetical protein